MEIEQIINKIEDTKLKPLLEEYVKSQSPIMLLMIVEYKGVKLSKNSVDAVITKTEINNGKVELGGLIINGVLYKITLDNGVLVLTKENKIEL